MTENGSCEGCIMFINYKYCDIIRTGREEDCPCRNCLVKVICTETCDKYNVYLFDELQVL